MSNEIIEGNNDPFVKYKHLADLKKEAETVPKNGRQYWKLRCTYLEKSIDKTYSEQERNNCFRLYQILINR